SGLDPNAPGIPPAGPYQYDKEPIIIDQEQPDGSYRQIQGYLIGYGYKNQSYDNGYNLVAWQDIPDWVKALDGNLTYVTRMLQNQQVTVTDSHGDSMSVVNFAQLEVYCACHFESATPTVTY
ncbi:hypothetical protein BGP34_31600, partial [Bacillus mycoides]|uniref:hypothetical protein n=1 Tax=Bacillus mycoides TaxID=1405 RepID=UPI0009CAE7DC